MNEKVSKEKDRDGVPIIEIKSAFEITDADFINPQKSFKLPAIKTKVWIDIVKDTKAVLLKKRVLTKQKKHIEFRGIEKEIINNALTKADQILLCKPKDQPYYYSIVKSGEYYDLAVIDVFPGNPYNEIVGWRRIRQDSFDDMKKQELKNKKTP